MGLIPSRPSEEQISTAELPRPDLPVEAEPEQLSIQELEITTADTRPLPLEMAQEQVTAEPKTDEEQMESKGTQTGNTASQVTERVSGPLLDLGDFEPAHAAAEDDFVLDIDLDEVQEVAPAASPFASQAVSGRSLSVDEDRQAAKEFGMVEVVESEVESLQAAVAEPVEPTVDPMAETQEMIHPTMPSPQGAQERAFAEPEILEGEMLRTPGIAPVADAGQVSLEQLSPEAIDAIARRAVEMLSERAVQEIAWEVVPQLAELMIKRQLEEKNS
jgi:hypothetical protein